jgi:hypothetical protein
MRDLLLRAVAHCEPTHWKHVLRIAPEELWIQEVRGFARGARVAAGKTEIAQQACRTRSCRRAARYNGRLNTMRKLRTRKSLVLFGLAIVVFAAFVPALAAGLPAAILTPLWIVVPAVSIVVIRRTAARCDDQPVALLSLALFRAPPATLALA